VNRANTKTVMSRATLNSTLSIFTLGLCAAFAVFAGCSNQAEGQACNVDNIDADCEEGLVCRSKTELDTLVDICCKPKDSDNPACIPGTLAGSSSSSSSSSGAGGGGAGGGGGTGGGGGGAGAGAGGGT